MARLVYSTIASLDGYVADERGEFGWAAPDEEVHGFINDLERPNGTYLYGRRMYEVMRVWEDMPTADEPPVIGDFAQLWRAADKVVYSTSLGAVSTPRTGLERRFDPDAITEMKAVASMDIGVGGPELAGQALRAGLVDEIQLFAVPVLVGAGTPAFPHDIRLGLELADERRFASGVVYLRYRVTA